MNIELSCTRERMITSSEDVNTKGLEPVMWITDEMLDRATYIAPITGRHEGDPRIEVSVPLQAAVITFMVTLIPDEGRRVVYVLEGSVRDFAMCTTRMRWPD